ncbi:hypothetical protein [Roseibium polysiphoniae]|uniref:hypothetical protein n=1 Tax=Roseibium polysiphoniae TaxID=2571221 RepID=UPI00308462EF
MAVNVRKAALRPPFWLDRLSVAAALCRHGRLEVLVDLVEELRCRQPALVRAHQAERAKALADDVGLDVTIIVLACKRLYDC